MLSGIVFTVVFTAMLLAAVFAVGRSRRSNLLGLLLAIPVIVLQVVRVWRESDSIAIAAHVVGLLFLAYTVVYHEFGSKLLEESDASSEFKATLYGGLVAEAAFLAPVFGQLYSIALFARSLGAVTMVILGDVVSPKSSS